MISNTFSSLHKLIEPWTTNHADIDAIYAWHRRVIEVPQGELSLLLHLYESEVSRHAGLVRHIRDKIGFRVLVALGLSRWAMRIYFGPVVPIVRKDRTDRHSKTNYRPNCGIRCRHHRIKPTTRSRTPNNTMPILKRIYQGITHLLT